jgi:hypothetical protein
MAHLAAVYTIIVGVGATMVGAHLAPRMKNIMKHHDGPSALDRQVVRTAEPVSTSASV